MDRSIIHNKFFLSFFLICLVLISCDKQSEDYSQGGDIDVTEKLPKGIYGAEVNDPKSRSEKYGLVLNWEAPSDASNLSHYLVEWKGTVKDTVLFSQRISKENKSIKLTRLQNEEYNIVLKCVDKKLQLSTGVTIKGSSIYDTEEPGEITDLKFSTLAVSSYATWKNPTKKEFENIMIQAKNQKTGTETLITLPAQTTSYNIGGLDESTEYEIRISTVDYLGNSSAVVDNIKTYREVMLSKKTPWTIVDFSSEEHQGEGPYGRAEQAIDGQDNTYWNSNWTEPDSSLPQWIIFDIKQEVIPTVLISYKRLNSENGPTKVKVEGSLDLISWYDFGTTDLSPTKNEGQNCYLKDVEKVRYIRYTVLLSPNDYAVVRNIDIKALVE